jgi:hypothetical protein
VNHHCEDHQSNQHGASKQSDCEGKHPNHDARPVVVALVGSDVAVTRQRSGWQAPPRGSCGLPLLAGPVCQGRATADAGLGDPHSACAEFVLIVSRFLTC